MIKKFGKYTLLGVLLIFIMSSCTEEVDFNQIDDLSLKPVFASDLIFFNAPATKFYVNGSELETVRDTVVIDLFNRDFVVENLVKAEFVFETTNSINRAFSVKVEFLDASDQLKHSFTVTTPASPSNTDIVSTHTEVFENGLLNALKASNKVVLTIQALSGGSPLTDNTPGRIKLKSKGVFYLKVEKSE